MMLPNTWVNLSSGEAPDLRFERTLCWFHKNRFRFMVMSSCQKQYLEDLLKNDCKDSRRFLQTRWGGMYVPCSEAKLPVP